jgi:hypothetical protein
MPMDSPMIYTSAWSAIVPGLVRKKKPKVIWNSDTEVMIVLAEISAMMLRYVQLDLMGLKGFGQGRHPKIRKLAWIDAW